MKEARAVTNEETVNIELLNRICDVWTRCEEGNRGEGGRGDWMESGMCQVAHHDRRHLECLLLLINVLA